MRRQSVVIKRPVTITALGSVTLTTNDAGRNGDLLFQDKGKFSFRDAKSSLIINSRTYILVNSIADLSAAVVANPAGYFALASDYDAAADGAFGSPPIHELDGTFEGLGNRITHLTIKDKSRADGWIGFISFNKGVIRDLTLAAVKVMTGHYHTFVATLVSSNLQGATITHSHVSGAIVGGGSSFGGLVGDNGGTIAFSSAAVSINPGKDYNWKGGLVAHNAGHVIASYAIASITSDVYGGGGLVGFNTGRITDSYARGTVTFHNQLGLALGGGLVGSSEGPISTSYSTVTVDADTAGGFVGFDQTGDCDTDYWDLDTSGVSNPHKGAWKPKDDPGITGLTDAQL